MSLLDLLMAQNVAEFNARRGQRVTLDLFAADLANLDLGGVDLSGANLEKADFSGTNLAGSNLSKATLVGADFTGAKLQRVVAIKAKLREAYLGGADLTEAELGGADLGEADLGGATLTRARLHGAKLREATLRGAILDHADLGEAKLASADLQRADLLGADLREADLTAANLDAASLEDANLSSARLGGATLRAARLVGARLAGVDLSAADLTGAVFDETTIFDGADLTDTVLDDALTAQLRGGIRPAAAFAGSVDIHVDDPALAQNGGQVAVLWPNAEGGEAEVFRLLVRATGGKSSAEAQAVPVDAAAVRARALLPAAAGFFVVFLVEKPGGTDLVVIPVSRDGTLAAPRSTRLGYTPAVLPNFVPDGDGFFVFGIGRGTLSVHRWTEAGLVERLRAPASTIRGFCDRQSPVVHSKGGTVMVVEPDGIGRALTAPPDFPGRRFAAAPVGDEVVVLAWVKPEEKGFRLLRLGQEREPQRVETGHHVGVLDVRAADGGCWVAWTREPVADRDVSMAMAAFLAADGTLGKPFPLLAGSDADDVEDLCFASGEGPARVGCVTIDEALLVVELGPQAPRVVARVGG